MSKYTQAAELLASIDSPTSEVDNAVFALLNLAAAQLPEGEAERVLREAAQSQPSSNGYTVWHINGRIELWNTGARPTFGALLFTGTYEQCKAFVDNERHR